MPKKDYIVYTDAPIKMTTGLGGDTIVFRDEQKEAIKLARTHFEKKADYQKFLWNAKMRFGKTLCALKLAREMSESQRKNRRVKRVLIVTHRPVVNDSWKEDFNKIFGDIPTKFKYGTKFDDDATGNFFDLESHADRAEDNGYVFFASMQYLRRSNLVNDKDKEEADPDNEHLRNSILENDWDLVVIDEAHEGTRTSLGSRVIEVLKKEKTKMLHLSGTPFNLYDDFNKDEEIYTWDYVMEQTAKREWDEKHPGEYNPYAVLPEMRIFTYDLSENFSTLLQQEGVFSFREFFRIWTGNPKADHANMPEGAKGRFVHKEEVNKFLNLLCTEDENTNYPFSKSTWQESFKHTLWIVPGVKEAKALKTLLDDHEVFSNFEVINVAGESDDDEKSDNALDKVLKAIGKKPADTATITISCGRLTTGVTVHPWTAVLYLKGSENTSAATYMQTIFRVQSTDTETYPDKMKSRCYVFDFLPLRTLKMVAETSKFSEISRTKADKKSENKADDEDIDKSQEAKDKEVMKAFVDLCPVISLSNSTMTALDVNEIYKQLEDVYIERLVRKGFDDPCLYNQTELNRINPDIINYIGKNGGKAPDQNRENAKNTIDLTHMTDEQRRQWEEMIRKKKKEAEEKTKKKAQKDAEFKQKWDSWTEEQREEWLKEEAERIARREKAKEERNEFKKRITNIRGIALRIPLLMYGGADVGDHRINLTVDNFTQNISDESWVEFMPKGITKADFNNIKKCFNATRFEEAGKKYCKIVEEADSMHIEERIRIITDIFNSFRNPDKETVLTPWRVVNMHMGDTLGGWCWYDESFDDNLGRLETPRYVDKGEVSNNIFNNIDKHGEILSRILEINSKTGLYPLYITYSLYPQRLKEYIKAKCIEPDAVSVKDEQVVWDDIVKNNIYVICNTPMAARITERTLLGFRDISKCHIKEEKLIERASRDQEALVRDLKSVAFWKNNKSKEEMKFDAIVGNPPYQVMDGGGTGSSALPIYQKFVYVSRDIMPKYISLIMPSRWMTGGKGLDAFREAMLHDTQIRVMHDYLDCQEVFPDVAIEGGICYYRWDKGENGLCDFVSHSKGMVNITTRALCENGSDVVIRNVDALSILKKTEKDYKSNPFSNIVSPRNPFRISDVEISSHKSDRFCCEIFGRFDGSRSIKYTTSFTLHENGQKLLKNWKVFISKADGAAGQLGNPIPARIIGKSELGNPNMVCTETFLAIGPFNTKGESVNVQKYLETRFLRFLVGIRKLKNMTQDTYSFVPLQDFTENSDIDWSDSIEGIDRQLYKKYGLTKEEIDFIESMIKPME